MRGAFAAFGALSGALVVATGAFGAHALRGALDARRLETWETAVHWQAVHAVALLLVAIAGRVERDSPLRAASPRLLAWAGWAFVAGTVLFSGSLYALALTDARALGAVTPFGGLAFAGGWLALAAAVWPRRP